MVLDNSYPSILTDIMGIGVNFGTVFYVSKQRKENEKEILEFIQKSNSKQNKSLKFIEKIMNPFLEDLFNHMPLPRNIKKKQIIDYIMNIIKNKVIKLDENKKEKDLFNPKFLLFLKEILSLRKQPKNEVRKITQEQIARITKTLKKLFSGIMDVNIQSINKSRKALQILYLESDFPPKFIIALNKMFDVLITYYKYLENEVGILFEEGIKILIEGRKIEEINENPLFTVNIDEILILQFNLYMILVELILFIEIWNVSKLEELFTKREKEITYKKVNKKFFNKTIEEMDSMAEELHQIILDSIYQRKAKVPYTLEDNKNITENEKEFFANLIL